MVPRRDLIFLDMSVEDAAKYIISIGVIAPEMEAEVARLADRAKGSESKAETAKRLSAE